MTPLLAIVRRRTAASQLLLLRYSLHLNGQRVNCVFDPLQSGFVIGRCCGVDPLQSGFLIGHARSAEYPQSFEDARK